MAKFKKDDLIVDEDVVGAKTPEDWAAQGFTPVGTTPEVPAPVVPPVAPTAPITTPATPKGTGWYDEVTGKSTPVGVGTPRPVGTQPAGQQILNEEDLAKKRQELGAAGVPKEEWNKYISSPDAQGKLYFTQPATLTSPKGKKKVVGVGSAEASQLLSTGWTLGDKVGGGTIRSDTLPDVDEISVEEQAGVSGSLADQTAASVEADIKSTQDQINKNLEMLKAPEGDLSTDVQKLLDEAGLSAGELTGRGEAQLTEEAKRKIEEQQTVMANKNTELEKKLAEIKSLTASYQLANQQEEGRPQTLSRLQGAQAQNYKMYLAQKNALTSEAGYMQAELLGLQGKLDSAQSAANRAVDLEYADREADYNAKINQLNLLLPQLEKEEAQYAQAVQTTLQQQADALDEQKAERKQIQSVKLQAISAGITDPNILNQIGNSSSYDEALQILGTNIPEEVAGGGGGVAGGTGRGDDDETSEWDYARNILEANPNATDEELKTGLLENTELNVSEINSLIGTRPQKQAPEVYSDEWFKSKIDISKQQGYSIDEIVDFLIENYSEDELFKVAKEKGFAKWHTGKTSDIKRYVESLI